MNSIHIGNWNDLKQFGINPLTGEACAYSMRTLCDLSQKGAELMCDFLGLQIRSPMSTVFAANWNSNVGEDTSVASVMIARGLFPDLCRFALFKANMELAVRKPDGSWSGYADLDDEMRKRIVDMANCDKWELHRNPRVGQGSRNQHAFSGRTE